MSTEIVTLQGEKDVLGKRNISDGLHIRALECEVGFERSEKEKQIKILEAEIASAKRGAENASDMY